MILWFYDSRNVPVDTASLWFVHDGLCQTRRSYVKLTDSVLKPPVIKSRRFGIYMYTSVRDSRICEIDFVLKKSPPKISRKNCSFLSNGVDWLAFLQPPRVRSLVYRLIKKQIEVSYDRTFLPKNWRWHLATTTHQRRRQRRTGTAARGARAAIQHLGW